MTDPQNPQTPAAEPVIPAPPAENVSAPANTAAPDPTPAATSSAPAPGNPMAAAGTTSPSASAVLGKILGYTASVLVGIIPTTPVGVVTEAATIAEGGLRAISEWLTTKGSDNALTEAQAEAALQNLLKNLATLTAPLPTPTALENPPAPAS